MIRYENKYAVDDVQLCRMLCWLDGHQFFRTSFPERRVKSIYFDSLDFECATENLTGLADRKKFRIRWYTSPHRALVSEEASFEIKIKRGRLGFKRTVALDLNGEELMALDNAEISNLVCQNSKITEMFPQAIVLRPSLFVQYDRNYYAGHRGIRVTVDERIKFGDAHRNRHQLPKEHVGYAKSIIEFKFPPEIKDQVAHELAGVELYPVRSSKYLLGLSMFDKAVYF